KQVLDNLSIKPKKVSFSKVYYISFEDIKDEQDLYKSLSYNQRRNIKKYLNRLRKIDFVFEGIKDYKLVLNEAINLITIRHKETYWNDPLYIQTMEKSLNFFNSKGMLETFVMKSKGDIMSINITLVFEKRAFWWITAFNDKYNYFSPSRISVWYMLNYYLNKGFKEFNFMKGEAEYKTLWTKKYYKLYRYEFENPNLIKKVFSFFI
ncbi:MAG: GNAT family N-acetyltransferase, partial [candidate division WOR-3 bacterium]